jgi:hypothetical protein
MTRVLKSYVLVAAPLPPAFVGISRDPFMPLNLGWTTIDDEGADVLYSFASLIDYDPASSNLGDAVGDHYETLRTNGDVFLLRYRIRGQESFGAPAFTAAEGFFPIPWNR